MNERIQQTNKQGWRLFLALVMVGLFSIGPVQPVYAADFRSGDTIVIGADEVVDDDLFVSGQTVIVDGVVTGNLFAAGGTVAVNGSVNGSLFITGQSLAVNGVVDGSVYAAGYALTLGPAAAIARNLYFGGFSLTTASASRIGRSLYGGGYQLLLNGAVTNDVNVGASALELNGSVGGDVRGTVGNPEEPTPTIFMPSFTGSVTAVPPGLRVSEDAQVAGDVAVTMAAVSPADVAPFYSPANARTRWLIGEFITLLLIGALLLWLRPTWLRRTSTAAEQWLPSMGRGLLTLFAAVILIPVALALIILLALAGGWLTFGQLAAPILGVGLAALVLAIALLLFVAGLLSKIIVAYLGGRLLLRRSLTASRSGLDFVALAVGLVIYMVLRALPFGIGWVIGLLVTLLGLGAIWVMWRRIPRPRTVTVVTTRERSREVPV
ncbi:MAG: hypothetical protein DYG89_24815 [Caldilinea sp. CFX5]|nr:hypothetical protein [Caldilinea sp. CFX5]